MKAITKVLLAPEAREMLIRYNGDDCRATAAVPAEAAARFTTLAERFGAQVEVLGHVADRDRGAAQRLRYAVSSHVPGQHSVPGVRERGDLRIEHAVIHGGPMREGDQGCAVGPVDPGVQASPCALHGH